MVTALQAAGVVAAISFAALAAAGTYALIRFTRVATEASRAVGDWRARSDLLLGRADSAVERAHGQLARTDEITATMDEVSTSIAELTAGMSMLTRAVRTVTGTPLSRVAGFTFGLRRAVALRRAGPAAGVPGSPARGMGAGAHVPPAALPGPGQPREGAGRGGLARSRDTSMGRPHGRKQVAR